MGGLDDLGYGILKPIKDACAAIVSTILVSTLTDFASKYSTQVFGSSFNMVTFTLLFFLISVLDDGLSMLIYDSKKIHEPFDGGARVFGIIIGMFIFNGPLVLLYAASGGSLGEAIISWIVSLAILIVFTFIRHRSKGG